MVQLHASRRRQSTILRARCEIEEPAPTVLRDIVYADRSGQAAARSARPSDGRRRVHGLRLAPPHAGRRRHDRMRKLWPSRSAGCRRRWHYDGALDGFGTHPIVGDGYHHALHGPRQGARTAARSGCFLPSPDHRGATPPMIAEVKIDARICRRRDRDRRGGHVRLPPFPLRRRRRPRHGRHDPSRITTCG